MSHPNELAHQQAELKCVDIPRHSKITFEDYLQHTAKRNQLLSRWSKGTAEPVRKSILFFPILENENYCIKRMKVWNTQKHVPEDRKTISQTKGSFQLESFAKHNFILSVTFINLTR